MVFHLPQGALALALWPQVKPETGRKRVQRSLARLAEAGLLAFAPRVGNALNRQTGKPLGWKDGTVFRVRLRPGRARPQNLRAGLRNALQDVKLRARQERPRFVGRTGELLARALRDPGSVNLYRALLWGALRRKDRGEDRFEALWNALDRVLTALQEGFAKKPGALLIARLRESGLRALLLEGPQYRVA